MAWTIDHDATAFVIRQQRKRAKELADWLHYGQPDETSSASSAIQP